MLAREILLLIALTGSQGSNVTVYGRCSSFRGSAYVRGMSEKKATIYQLLEIE